MNDDEIIRQRISGRSARAIAKAQATTVAEVNKALDRFTETTIVRACRMLGPNRLSFEVTVDHADRARVRPSPAPCEIDLTHSIDRFFEIELVPILIEIELYAGRCSRERDALSGVAPSWPELARLS